MSDKNFDEHNDVDATKQPQQQEKNLSTIPICNPTSFNQHFEIDGSVLEGGGEIFRIAISLASIISSITSSSSSSSNVELTIDNIRANRPKQGLRAQHLLCLQLASQITNGTIVDGEYVGACTIRYRPGGNGSSRSFSNATYHACSTTGSSISLLLQTAMPILLYLGKFSSDDNDNDVVEKKSLPPPPPPSISSTLQLNGGTWVPFSPPLRLITTVLYPLLVKHFHLPLAPLINIRKDGYLDSGGGRGNNRGQANTTMSRSTNTTCGSIGEVYCTIQSLPPNTPLQACTITELGTVTHITGWCVQVYNDRLLSEQTLHRFTETMLSSVRKTLAVIGNNSIVVSSSTDAISTSSSTTSTTCWQDQIKIHCPQTTNNIATCGIQLYAHTSTGAILSASELCTTPPWFGRKDSGGRGRGRGGDNWRGNRNRGNARGRYGDGRYNRSFHHYNDHDHDHRPMNENIDNDHHDQWYRKLGERVASRLVHQLQTIGAPVDEYTQDQLIIFMALANGRSTIVTGDITLHTRTAIYVVEQMLPQVKFQIESISGTTTCRHMITCDGIGLTTAR